MPTLQWLDDEQARRTVEKVPYRMLATVHSAKDVEQLLGRVLRMPYARRREAEELNRAYAHVSSSSWPAAIVLLRDRLVSMVFDEVEAEFIRFLSPKLRHKHIRQPVLNEYLRGVITYLQEKRGLSLALLQSAVFRLEDVLKRKIAKSVEQAKAKGFQTLLFSKEAEPEAGYEVPYLFPKADAYTPLKYYRGKYDFQHLFYADVAAFDSGEEEDCAWLIDNLPQVESWVRNIANDDRSYKIPKTGGAFYPDFVARLKDGRRLVVEYKGDGYKTNDDSKEKNISAQLTAKASKGQLLYVMAVGNDELGRSVEGQIKAVLNG